MRYIYASFFLGAIVLIAACGRVASGAATPQPQASSVGGTNTHIITLDGLNIEDDGIKCGPVDVLSKPAADYSADDVATLVTYFNSENNAGIYATAPFPSTLLGEQAGTVGAGCGGGVLTIANTRKQAVEIDNVIMTYAQASAPNTAPYRLYGCREFASHPCAPSGLGAAFPTCHVDFTLVPGQMGKRLASPCATTLQPGGAVEVDMGFTGRAQDYIVNFGLSLGDGSSVTLPANFASSHVLDFSDLQRITCNHRQGNHIVQLPYHPSVGCQFPDPTQ